MGTDCMTERKGEQKTTKLLKCCLSGGDVVCCSGVLESERARGRERKCDLMSATHDSS